MAAKTPRHAHEMEKNGEVRWTAKFGSDGLLKVTDEASLQTVDCVAYTLDGPAVRFSLPGDNGMRVLNPSDPGYEAFRAVVEKATGGASEADAAPAAPASASKSPK